MVPNPVVVTGLLLATVGIEWQVRLVEEPHLCRVHGRAYTDYTARVGRFLPGLGVLTSGHFVQAPRDAMRDYD